MQKKSFGFLDKLRRELLDNLQAGGIPEGTSDGMSEGILDGIPRGNPDGISGGTSVEIVGVVPNGIPGETSEEIS